MFCIKQCITESEPFEAVCLNRHVLQAAIASWIDFHPDERNLENINFRFISYKQYIWWSYGYLGKRKRNPLPNCVIAKIRKTFPHQNNMYAYLTLKYNIIILFLRKLLHAIENGHYYLFAM